MFDNLTTRLSRVLKSLRGSGINVVAIHPGANRTERTLPADEEKLSRGVSIGRIVDSSEIAFLVAFLASPKIGLSCGTMTSPLQSSSVSAPSARASICSMKA